MANFYIDKDTDQERSIRQGLNDLSSLIHEANEAAGWWDDGRLMLNLKVSEALLRYVIPTKLCLVHSEISEALEGYRKGLNDDHLPNRKMIEVELADALIRIFDVAGALELDLGGALVEKFNYNQTRPDHKKEAREAPGGKSV